MSDSIKLSIELDNAAAVALSNLTSKAAKADKSFEQLGHTGKDTFSDINLHIGKSIAAYDVFLGSIAAHLAEKAFETIKEAASELYHEIIEDAAHAEQSLINFNAALRSAGLYSEHTSEGFVKFAESLQKTTIYSKEAVLDSAALLASLTNLDSEGIQKAIIGATNLAATLNVPLQEATTLIQKSVNGNTTAFAKKGISIQKADTSAGRLANTLAALASQEGRAEAATTSYNGALAVKTHAQHELLESIGKIIIQNPLVVAGLKSSAETYEHLSVVVNENKQVITDLATAVILTVGVIGGGIAIYYAASAAFVALSVSLALGTTAFELIGFAAASAWTAITAPISLVVIGIGLVVAAAYAVVKNFDSIKAAAYNALAAVLEFAAQGVSAIGGNASQLKAEAEAWREKAQAIKDTARVASEEFKADAEQADIRLKKIASEREDIARTNLSKQEDARIQAETLAQIEVEKNDNIQAIKDGYDADELTKRQEHETALLQLQIDADVAKALLEKDAQTRRDNLIKISDKAAIDQAKLRAKQEAEIAKAEIQRKQEVYGTIATLASSHNNVLATIGKAAGLVQIAIATPPAVAKAYEEGGPYLGPVLAAATYAAMGAQAAKLAGINFASGGIVPGTSFTGDKVAANVNSSEMILNRSQQAQLFELANGRGQTSDNSELIGEMRALRSAFLAGSKIEIDGKEVFNVLRDGQQSGRRF